MNNLIIDKHSPGIYKLTTAEILYFIPDYQHILQLFVWQEFDLYPDFPNLTKFVTFWHKELDGKIHSIRVSASDEIIVKSFQNKYELN